MRHLANKNSTNKLTIKEWMILVFLCILFWCISALLLELSTPGSTFTQNIILTLAWAFTSGCGLLIIVLLSMLLLPSSMIQVLKKAEKQSIY